MRDVLVLANQTLGGPRLQAAIEDAVSAGPVRFYVVVPATQPADLYNEMLSAYEGELPSESEARADARMRLDLLLSWLTDSGIEAQGEVADPDPLVAVKQACEEHDFDELIVSTLAPGVSRWLARDLVHQLERTVDIPVTHIYGLEWSRS